MKLLAYGSLIKPETFQSRYTFIGTLKFKMFPASIFHNQIHILISFSDFKMHRLCGRDRFHLSMNSPVRKQIFRKILHNHLHCRIFMLSCLFLCLLYALFLSFPIRFPFRRILRECFPYTIPKTYNTDNVFLLILLLCFYFLFSHLFFNINAILLGFLSRVNTPFLLPITLVVPCFVAKSANAHKCSPITKSNLSNT